MARFLLHDSLPNSRKVRTFLLAFVFTSGLIVGWFLYGSAEYMSVSWMRGAANGSVSIVGLLNVILLPFLFSAAAVYLSQPWLLMPIAFCKSLAFVQVSLGIMAAYGTAGWLMRVLLMFSDILTLPLLVLFWLRYGAGQRRLSFGSLVTFFIIAFFIGSIDIWIISPFLAGLQT